MSIFNDKALKSVAEIAAKIMAQESSHGTEPKTDKEKKLAALSHPKDKVTHKDVLVGRGVLKKEEKEQLDEYESKGGVYKHKGTYGYAGKGAEHGETDYAKENDAAKAADKPARKKYGARQNYVRSTRINEGFTDMLQKYDTEGLKAFVKLQEEPDNEQFTKELEDQKASMEGKKKQPSVAAASTQGVKNMPEQIEVIDANEVNGVTVQTIEEKTLTKPEVKKKEEVVKSMKKKLPGFKERYGDRAKSVMYATATKIAKEKA